MKLTAIFLTIAFLQVHAKGLPQITLSLKNVPMEKVFHEIERQSGIGFLYTKRMLADLPKVTIQVRNASVDEVLNECFQNYPLEYSIENNVIVLKRRMMEALPLVNNVESLPPPVQITGQVTNQSGEPLPNVSVIIVGSKIGATTNNDGHFSIAASDNKNIVLEFSSVGYTTQRVNIGNRTTINVVLELEVAGLSDVVVVGYGTQRKKDLTGSISSVKVDNLTDMPIVSIDEGLSGQIPGVQITQTSGAPGSASMIRIRGGNSLSGDNEPLFVVDGMPLFSGTGTVEAGAVRNPGLNILSLINPSDIASIDVLKDASATAIYGSRGANGVIMITTKSGIKGKPQINFRLSAGMQQPKNIPKLLNARQYATAINLYNEDVGLPKQFSPEEINALGEGTDWLKTILRTAPIYDAQFSTGGGSEDFTYNVSAGFLSQSGILDNSKLNRYSLNVNIQKKLNNRLNLKNQSLLSFADNAGVISDGGYSNTGVSSAIYSAIEYSPLSPVKDSDGNYIFSVEMEPGRQSNPSAILNAVENKTKILNILNNLSLDYRIIKDLTFRISGGVNILNSKENFYESRQVIEGRDNDGVATLGNVMVIDLLNENILEYHRKLGSDHNLNVLIGFTAEKNHTEAMTASSTGFVNDILQSGSLGSGTNTRPASSNLVDWSLLSYLSRINYIFKDRILVTATGRYDGSSRFGKDKRFGFFPSGAIAWRLSEENFIKNMNFFQELKARVSYGITGNQAVAPFQSIARLNSSRVVFNDGINVGFSPANIPNPQLGWEQTAQLDVGLDFSILKERLFGSFDFYNKKTSDLLIGHEIQNSLGFGTITSNLGKMQNEGIEISLNSEVLSSRVVKWDINFNLSRNWNKVLDLGGQDRWLLNLVDGSTSYAYLIEPGGPIGNFFGLVSDGIFKDTEDVNKGAQSSAKPGDRKYRDINGDNVINAEDRVVIGNFLPKWQFGMTNIFSFKNLDLSFVIQGIQGNKIFNSQRVLLETFWPGKNVYAKVIEGSSDIIRIGDFNPSQPFQLSTHYLENGSFLRLKNVTIGYTFKWNNTAIKNLRIYVSGQDLYTLTKYTGFDPEVSRNGRNNLYQGVDLSSYPRAKTYTVGISTNF